MTELNQVILDEVKKIADKNNNAISVRAARDFIGAELKTDDEVIINKYLYSLDVSGIVLSESDDQEDYASRNYAAAIESVPADVNITSQPLALYTVSERLKYNEIDLDTEFQRNAGIWSDIQQSQLIESLMLQIPIPAFYFFVEEEDKWKVIDGLQRLTAIKRFVVDKELRLCGLEYLTEFEDSAFDELPRQYARRINETSLQVYRVEKNTPRNVVFNIFKRLNTGGIVLNQQEIRHALYQGSAVGLIDRMVKSEAFLLATGYAIRTKRMLDREYATRFIAFTELDLGSYNGSIETFLNQALSYTNNLDNDKHDEIFSKFERVMYYCFRIFDKYAFRKIGAKGNRGPINKAVFELWSIVFSQKTDIELECLVSKKEILLSGFKKLLETDDFETALRSGDRYSLQRRLACARQLVEDVLNG